MSVRAVILGSVLVHFGNQKATIWTTIGTLGAKEKPGWAPAGPRVGAGRIQGGGAMDFRRHLGTLGYLIFDAFLHHIFNIVFNEIFDAFWMAP